MSDEQPSDLTQEAPHPGSKAMPQWNVGELQDAPKFTKKNWFAMLGPGLLMGGSAIGGGEWLMGPIVTAKYGGSLMWLATLSVLGQVIYNLEICRYTLYCGEPIFNGKFRLLPHPLFWVLLYLLLDFGSVFPYLAANAATPLASVILGHIPNPDIEREKSLLRTLGYVIFLGALLPLIFGGKIYNALKKIMAFKVVTVLGFLVLIGLCYSNFGTWVEVFSGFGKFGSVPIKQAEDQNGNGILDEGENDWDKDGIADVIEPSLKLVLDSDGDGQPDATDIDGDGVADSMVTVEIGESSVRWPDLNSDGIPDSTVFVDLNQDGKPEGPFKLDANADGQLDRFLDIDSDGTRDGDAVENLFVALIQGRPMPDIDWSMIGFLSALVAISGSGGLSNAPISNYTRDQGWGMGSHVGAIPSVVGGQDLQLSHEGTVFIPNSESMPKWKRWYKHLLRDQLIIWMPACFLGLALPSLLSVEFLPRGTEVDNNWIAAGMTADAVKTRVGGSLGNLFWFMTLFCGFLVLAPSMATSADGIIRRWVDAFWTASPTLRRMKPENIRYVYFTVLILYAMFGVTMLSLGEPTTLLLIATTIFNFALGFSCWHTLAVNLILLPQELRPNWFMRIALFSAGAFFWLIATVSALQKLGYI